MNNNLKIALLAFLLFPILPLQNQLSAQRTNTSTRSSNGKNNSSSHEGIKPWGKKDYADKNSSWSLFLEAGTSFINGDVKQASGMHFSTHEWIPTGGFGLEHSFNSVWGIMGRVYHAPYSAADINGTDNDLTGLSYATDLSLTFDLIDAWYPQRQKSIFSLYFTAGAGVAYFDAQVKDDNGTLINDISKATSRYAGIIPLGLRAEFNLGRHFAIGVSGQYRMFMTDYLDTYPNPTALKIGISNDFQENVMVNLRWKIGAKKRNHKINWRAPHSEDFVSRIKKINDTVKIMAESRVDTLYVIEKQTAEQPIVQEIKTVQHSATSSISQYELITFGMSSAKLNSDALVTIYKLAQAMKENPEQGLVLTGCCDNTGSDKYNNALSKKRAEVVKKELTEIYDIEPERIKTQANGKLNITEGGYPANRRVEIKFVDKNNLSEYNSQAQQANEQTAEDGDQEIMNDDIELITTVTVKRGDRLAQFAREYYGDPLFWVYIYEANQDILKAPNRLLRKTRLKIPAIPQDMLDTSNVELMQTLQETADKYLH